MRLHQRLVRHRGEIAVGKIAAVISYPIGQGLTCDDGCGRAVVLCQRAERNAVAVAAAAEDHGFAGIRCPCDCGRSAVDCQILAAHVPAHSQSAAADDQRTAVVDGAGSQVSGLIGLPVDAQAAVLDLALHGERRAVADDDAHIAGKLHVKIE